MAVETVTSKKTPHIQKVTRSWDKLEETFLANFTLHFFFKKSLSTYISRMHHVLTSIIDFNTILKHIVLGKTQR